MGGEIIAERFALLKTRGSNGLAFTHIVEDTLDGRRLVVKVSDGMGALGLEYLKASNLLAETGVEGVLLPMEGGFLEEGGCYLAFPELGEPSLEHYLRMRPLLSCEEGLFVLEEVLRALEGLHGAGFLHLFLEPRNIFYLPRRSVTLKDPALRPQFFHSLLEMVSAPDFSYLQPSLMDGGLPGVEADVYAVGRLAERLREAASDAGESPLAAVLGWLAERCRGEPGKGAGKDGPTAGEILGELRRARAQAAEQAVAAPAGYAGSPHWQEKRRWLGREGRRGAARRAKRRLIRPGMVVVLAWSALFVLAVGLGAALAMRSWEGPLSVAGARSGSEAGSAASRAVLCEAARRGADAEDRPAAGAGDEAGDEAGRDAAAEGGSGCSAALNGAEGAPQVGTEAGNGGTGAASPGKSGVPGTSPPVASFTISPAEGESPLRVFLDASASYDPDGSIVSYEWSCGRTGKALFHVFESSVIPARVAVTLTVTDDSGRTASVTRSVTLY